MQVTNVSARYMRKIQIREYEPAEAEVSFSAVVAEGEDDHAAIAKALMADAKAAVRDGLMTKVAASTAPAKDKAAAVTKVKEGDAKPAAEEKPADTKPKRTRRTKAQMEADAKAEEAKKAGGSDVPGDDDDVPGEEDAKGNISNNPEDRTDPNDVPGDDDDVPGEDVSLEELIGDGPTHDDLNELISNAVGGTGKKKVAGNAIKEILVAHKAARVRDVPTDQIQSVMDAIQAKIDG